MAITDLLPSLNENSAHVVKCYNYPNSAQWTDFDPFMSNVDPKLSEITEKNGAVTIPEEVDAFQFVDDHLENPMGLESSGIFFKTRMMPSFEEATNWVPGEEDVETFNAMNAT